MKSYEREEIVAEAMKKWNPHKDAMYPPSTERPWKLQRQRFLKLINHLLNENQWLIEQLELETGYPVEVPETFEEAE